MTYQEPLAQLINRLWREGQRQLVANARRAAGNNVAPPGTVRTNFRPTGSK